MGSVRKCGIAALRLVICAIVALGTTHAKAQAPTYRVTDLGAQFGTATETTALAINDAGQVVGLRQTGEVLYWSATEGARTITTGARGWSPPAGPAPTRFFINPAGQVAGDGYNDFDQAYGAGPFIWHKAVGLTSLNQLHGLSSSTQLNSSTRRTVHGQTDAGDVALLTTKFLTVYRGTTSITGGGVPGPSSSSTFFNASINNQLRIAATTQSPANSVPSCPPAQYGQLGVPYTGSSADTSFWNPLNSATCSGGLNYAQLRGINDLGQIIGVTDIYSAQQGATLRMGGLWDTQVSLTARPTPIYIIPAAINNAGLVVGTFDGGSTWDKTNGVRQLIAALDPSEPLRAQITAINPQGVNNVGQIVGDALIFGQRRAVVLTPSSTNPPDISPVLEIIEPTAAMVSGSVITSDISKLAVGGRIVRGVAADGVATLILRIRGGQIGEQFTFSIPDIGCEGSSRSTDVCGAVGVPGAATTGQSVSITIENTSQGPMGFAIYRAPVDFAWTESHRQQRTRTVSVSIYSAIRGTVPVTILVARPPIVLIHGLWGSGRDWTGFVKEFVTRSKYYDFPIVLDYSASSDRAISSIVPSIALEIDRNISSAKTYYGGVAVAQVDIVGHSMGGLVARSLYLSPIHSGSQNMNSGQLHKLITIGTPHFGSPFARDLLRPENSCMARAFNLVGQGVYSNGAVGDLVGNGDGTGMSSALKNMKTVPTSFVAGMVNPWQVTGDLSSLLDAVDLICYMGSTPLAKSLQPQAYFGFMNGSADGIVPIRSALSGGTVIDSSVSVFGNGGDIAGPLHSADTTKLGFVGEPMLSANSGVIEKVFSLLNTPLTDARFRKP